MQIEYVHLRNFCQHRDRRFEFPVAGVVILQGPNGAGKSSIVRAITFALTGATAGASREMLITWGETEGHVELGFRHNGSSGVIKRQLSKSVVRLTHAGQDFKAAREANAYLESLLGEASGLLGKFNLIRQGELNEMLLASNADRLKLLHRLFGTDRFETVYQGLGVELNNYSTITQLPEPVSVLQDRVRLLGDQIVKFEQQAVASRMALQSLDGEGARKVLAAAQANKDRLDNPVTGLIATSGKIEAYRKSHSEAIARQVAISAELVATRDGLAASQPVISQAQALVFRAGEAASHNQKRADLEAQLARLQDQLARVQPPPAFEARSDWYIQALCKQAELGNELTTCTNVINSFKSGICPTCGTVRVVHPDGTTCIVAESAIEAEKRLAPCRQELENLTFELAQYINAESAHRLSKAAYDDVVGRLNPEIDRVRGQLAAATELTFDPGAVDQARKLVGDYEAAHAHANTLAGQQDGANSLVEVYRSSVEAATAALADLGRIKAELAQVNIPVLEATVNAWSLAATQLATAEATLVVERRNLELQQNALAAAVEIEKQSAARVHYRDLLTKARDVFHRDSFPAAIARAYISRVNTAWNEVLTGLDVPFSARLTPELDVVFSFGDNQADSSQISGGQQCCASLAFLLAVNRLFAYSTGLLVLDEPTYGLDSDHIDRVADVLGNMQQYAGSAEMQILVVTHEEKLRQGFDNVVTL